MDFKDKIELLENEKDDSFIYNIGNLPILLTASHTMLQQKEDGSYKYNEPYTKAICKYVSEITNCSYLIKAKDTMIDANKDEEDEFKRLLLKIIEENNIKLVLDIHGASKDREFDIELGTLNNLSADYSTINELKEAFEEKGINNIVINEPFKGGGITRYIYGKTDIDAIQIEINRNYRDIEQIDNLENLCNSIINFINQYAKKQRRIES